MCASEILWCDRIPSVLGGGKPLFDDLTLDKLFSKLRARQGPSDDTSYRLVVGKCVPVCELLAEIKVADEIKSGRRADDGKIKQRTRGSARPGGGASGHDWTNGLCIYSEGRAPMGVE